MVCGMPSSSRRPLSPGARIAIIAGAAILLLLIIFGIVVARAPLAALILGPILGVLVLVALTVGTLALVFWIGYRLAVSAVRAGTIAAHEELARRAEGLPPEPWNTFAGRPEDRPA